MATSSRIGFAGVSAVLFATAASQCFAAEGSARAWLPKAERAAQEWKADAMLTRVGTTGMKEDGTAMMWQYSFFSPATTTCARFIIIGGGDPRIQDLGKCAAAQKIATDFVDSPVMVKEAVKAGFQPDESSDAYLVVMHDKAAPERECWVVHTVADFDRDKSVMRGWCVDPKTGRFVVRLSGERGGPG